MLPQTSYLHDRVWEWLSMQIEFTPPSQLLVARLDARFVSVQDLMLFHHPAAEALTRYRIAYTR